MGSHWIEYQNTKMEDPMEYLKGDRNTLYFIGNGFDLFHEGVKSKFIHFYSWLNLKDKQHEQFVLDMENVFPISSIHGNMLWTSFEKALGDFDIETVHKTFAGKEIDSLFDIDYQQRAASKIRKTFNKIPIYLKEWATQICTDSIKQELSLGKESKYLTFNYTLLLEKLYHISPAQIWHIHGCIDEDKPLITGHNQDFPEYFDDTESYNDKKSLENLSEEIRSLRKPVLNIIKSNKSYFKSLSHINKVIVFGHSLSKIDYPYFREVVNNVQDNTEWIYIGYDDAARNNYETIIKHYNNYVNNPMIIGVSQYKNKMNPKNCKYIYSNEL